MLTISRPAQWKSWSVASISVWALDVLTTVAVISQGGYEANHLAAALQANFGMLGWALAMLLPAVARGWLARGSRWPLATFTCRFAVVLHALVVAWNLSMIGLLLAGY